MHRLWNGIAQNYTDRFWWHLAEIFEYSLQLHVSVFMQVCFFINFSSFKPKLVYVAAENKKKHQLKIKKLTNNKVTTFERYPNYLMVISADQNTSHSPRAMSPFKLADLINTTLQVGIVICQWQCPPPLVGIVNTSLYVGYLLLNNSIARTMVLAMLLFNNRPMHLYASRNNLRCYHDL